MFKSDRRPTRANASNVYQRMFIFFGTSPERNVALINSRKVPTIATSLMFVLRHTYKNSGKERKNIRLQKGDEQLKAI